MKNSDERTKPLSIGVISDTHGLLRPGAIDVLQGVDLIIHVGDFGDPQIIDELGPSGQSCRHLLRL